MTFRGADQCVGVRLLMLCGLGLLAGCWEKEEAVAPVAAPFAGETVRIAVPAGHDFRTRWEIALNEWSAQTGAAWELAEVEDTLATVAADSKSSSEVVVFPITSLGSFLADDLLAPIPVDLQGDDHLALEDLFLGLRERGLATADGPAFLPFSSPVLVLYYRSDLLAAAGRSPPRTWEDYQQLLEDLPTWAPGLTAMEPWGEEFRATMFLARSAAYAQHPGQYSFFFNVETGAPQLGGQGFVKGLETSLLARAKLNPASDQADPADCRRAILSGKAALAIAFETGPVNPPLAATPAKASAVDEPLMRADGMEIGFSPLPGAREVYNPTLSRWEPAENEVNQVTLTGFGGLGIGVRKSAAGRQAGAAWSLIEVLMLGEGIEQPEAITSPTRESQLLQASAWVGEELAAEEAGKYLNAVAGSLRDRRLIMELPVPGREQFRQSLTTRLTELFAGQENSLATVVQDWQEILKQQGVESVRKTYRNHLRLSPLPAP